MNKFLWELLEMEAPLKFFINGKESPAFLLFPKWHFASTKTQHSLYMNCVGLIARFTSEKKALARLKQIVEHANFPMRLYKVSKYGRKHGKRILFAENTSEGVDMTNAKGPMKAFNIEEWQTISLKPSERR